MSLRTMWRSVTSTARNFVAAAGELATDYEIHRLEGEIELARNGLRRVDNGGGAFISGITKIKPDEQRFIIEQAAAQIAVLRGESPEPAPAPT